MGERGDQGFEVAPTRIGGSGGPARAGRGRRAPIIIVIAIAILVPTVAWIGPRIEWRPEIDLSLLLPTPTPVPSKTPRPLFTPAPGLATPLPALTVGTGPRPTEPFAVDVGGVRLADPTTGELGPAFPLRVDTDAVFTYPGGEGWWCICFERESEGGAETTTVSIRGVDRSGNVTNKGTIGEYRSTAPSPQPDFYVRLDLEVSADQRMAYLSSATRSGDVWSVVVEAIDLVTASVVGRTELGTIAIPPVAIPPVAIPPVASPTSGPALIETYFNGPFIRLSPDGRRLLVHAAVDSFSQNALPVEPVPPKAWLIDLDRDPGDGSVGRTTPLGGAFVARLRTCYWMAWTTDDELAVICWPRFDGGPMATLSLITPDGTELRSFDLFEAAGTWLTDPVLDRANRRVFVWQPGEHRLRRFDLESGKVEELKVDPAATGGGPADAGNETGPLPDWVTFTSDLRIYYGPQLVAEPGGRRLFALGVLSSESNNYVPASSGVWVFDSNGFALLDRWTAVAAYESIGLSGDGRWLYAAGAPSVDDAGNETAWESSITVHDVTDGRPALQFGRLGVDRRVVQVPP